MNHSQNNSTNISREIIPRHMVKGDDLFHFDHYESTILTITSKEISLVDYYFRRHETSTDTPIFELKVKQEDSIARLIQYFELNAGEGNDILNSLHKAFANYVREHDMKSLDLFGKLFKEIGVEFEAICHV